MIALLAFTGLSHSSDAGEGDTYKACWLRDNAWQFNLNLERCPGLEKGDVIGASPTWVMGNQSQTQSEQV